VIAIVGIILLIGIVKKNGIMLVDFAQHVEREQGLTAEESIYQACIMRFRPILMTTMAALLGGVPMMLGSGVGSELRQPLGYAIVGGLALSQVLTLYTTPVVYIYLDRLQTWLFGKRRKRRLAMPPRCLPNENFRELLNSNLVALQSAAAYLHGYRFKIDPEHHEFFCCNPRHQSG